MNKNKLIVTGLIVLALILVAVGLYFGGSNLIQMIQAHLAG
jgi:hypothetical protein